MTKTVEDILEELDQLGRDARALRRKAVIRECVTWLHDRAKSMNDPHARDVVNSAALHLGETLGRNAIKEPAHV